MSKSKAIISSYIGVIIFAAIIFLAGGRIDYWQAWLYLGLAIIGTTLTHLLTPKDSQLASERASRAKEGEAWDRKILGLIFLSNITSFTIAGLDSGRFKWSGEIPVWVIIIGAFIMIIGQIIFALARRENSFFSSTVRIENNRDHKVCETGLYKFVRHPGYLGMILSVVGFPLVIGSYWSFIPVIISIILILLRTNFEDSFLLKSLNHYHDYSNKVRSKLVPGIF